MKLFLWKVIEHVTFAYHDGGGLVVVAEDLEKARVFLRAQARVRGGELEQIIPDDCEAYTQEPDQVFALAGVHRTPSYVVFENAGCC